jgi:hypothetical protein
MANMRSQYRATPIATACQVTPVQIAPKQARWTRMKGIVEG